MKENKNGFTLLELLVVVVIIGILAAIALPQYKMAVAKSKLSTIRNMVLALHQSVERYYLATNTQPVDLSVLDIDMPGEYTDSSKIRKTTPEGITCGFNTRTSGRHEVICFVTILGTTAAIISTFYINKAKTERTCLAFSNDTNDLVNKLCQIETNKSADKGECDSGKYCLYRY